MPACRSRFSLRAARAGALAACVLALAVPPPAGAQAVAGAGPPQPGVFPPTAPGPPATATPGRTLDAEDLMRRVVARTRAQRAALGAYAATVYERRTVRGAGGAVASVTETAIKAYRPPEGGWRERVVAERRTANLERDGGAGLAAITGGVLTPSPVELGLLDLEFVDLLAADVEVGGHRLVGPTHPDALDVYEFGVVGRRRVGGRAVAEVALQPRRRTASAFRGTLVVLEATGDVLEADLYPGPAFRYPPPVVVEHARLRQRYVPVAPDSSAWLPADFQAELAVTLRYGGLLTVGPLAVEAVAQISEYQSGAAAPDVLRAGPGQRAARPRAARLPEAWATIPLEPGEQEAYAAGHSLAPVAHALRFRGVLAPVARGAVMGAAAAGAAAEPTPTFGAEVFPLVAVTPAEGLRVGAVQRLQVGPLVLTPSAAFRTADGGISLAAGARAPLLKRGPDGRALRLSAAGDIADDVARRAPPFAPDLLAAVGARGGYYARRRAAAGLVLERGGLGTVRFGGADLGVSAEASAQLLAETATTYKADPLPDGGGVTAAELDADLLTFGPGRASVTTRSVVARGGVGTLALPLGLAPRQAVQVAVEAGEWAGEGAFWSAETAVDVAVRTFARRRAVGPALYVRLGAGAAGGRLPLTRTLSVGGSLGDGGALGAGGFLGAAFTQFGQLRSWTGGPYEGDRYLAAYWEHTFGTLPFEVLGLDALSRNGYGVLVYGAHAQTWLAADRAAEYAAAGYPAGASDGWHHEVGVSLTGVLGLLRVDLTQRINAPGTVLGVGFARQL